MRKRYEAPTILNHLPGLANKFGRSRTNHSIQDIDGVSVRDLMQEHGSPLFVFSERTLRTTIREAKRAFEVRYPKVRFAWSYKTNYLDAICKVFHDEGAWAEVVSEYEYAMARRLGIPGDQIIYNGAYKPKESISLAATEGAAIHLDGHDELYLTEQVAKELGRPVDVGMRLNMDTGIVPAWSRFGFNLDSGEAWNALQRLHLGGHLRLTGLHAHIGTFIMDPHAYGTAVRKLVDFANQAKKLGFQIDYIDVGGGFPSSNTLHAQYTPGEEGNPGIEDYAEAIGRALLEAHFPDGVQPTLVLETGRALVDECGTLLSKIVANGRLPNGVRSMVIDAGVNVLFTSFWYKPRIVPAQENPGVMEETIVYGPLCMNIDVVRASTFLPPMRVGDAVVIQPVGAYNVTQWLQFIRMRPAVVMIGNSGQVARIRDAETIESLKVHEHIPEWMD
jgi:diaminopimelate decarboxylase